jgi:hypothetical protein
MLKGEPDHTCSIKQRIVRPRKVPPQVLSTAPARKMAAETEIKKSDRPPLEGIQARETSAGGRSQTGAPCQDRGVPKSLQFYFCRRFHFVSGAPQERSEEVALTCRWAGAKVCHDSDERAERETQVAFTLKSRFSYCKNARVGVRA